MTSFETAFACVIGVEGGYDLSTHDPGNWTGGAVDSGTLRGTKYGISAAAFPTLDIAALTQADAQALYRSHYWLPLSGDALPPPVGLIAFDCAVNQGLSIGKTVLQEAAGVEADGAIGPVTLAAVAAATPASLVVEIAARRAVRYAASDMAAYGLGWMRRLMKVTAQALG